MLLVTSKSPGYGKQKPRMWGPLSAVRSAMVKNAERLGIDPSKVVGLWPTWEGCGGVLHNVAGSNNGAVSGGAWTDSGLQYDGVDVSTALDTTLTFTDEVTVLFLTTAGATYDDYAAYYHKGSTTYRSGTELGIQHFASNLRLELRRGGSQAYTSGDFFVQNQRAFYAVVLGSAETLAYRDGTFLETLSALSYTSKGGTTYIGGGRGASLNQNESRELTFIVEDALTVDQLDGLNDAPFGLIQPVPLVTFFDLAAGGGPTVYDETVDSILASVSDLTDRQNYRDTADTLAESGASLSAVAALLDVVVTVAVSQAGVSDQQQYVDQADTVVVEQSDETDQQQYVDSGSTTAVESASVTDQMSSSFSETILTTAVSAAQVAAAQHYIDTLTSLAQSASGVDELGVIAEQVTTVAESLSSVKEQQHFYQAVATTAVTTGSIEAVQQFLETITDTAAASASVTDVLVGVIALSGRIDLTSRIWPRIDLTSKINQRIDLRSRLYIN